MMKDALQSSLPLVCLEIYLVDGQFMGDREVADRATAELRRLEGRVLEGVLHLDEGPVISRTRRAQRAHQFLDGQFMMRQALHGDLADPAQQLAEGWLARGVPAPCQRVD